MAHYCEVDSAKLEAHLQSMGFTRTVHPNTEVVYDRRHNKEPKLIIRCYTSISANASVARSCGEDAIRVIAILDTGSKTYPIFKGKRIHRTTSQESVQDRVRERAREAYARCNEWLKELAEKNGSFKFGANG